MRLARVQRRLKFLAGLMMMATFSDVPLETELRADSHYFVSEAAEAMDAGCSGTGSDCDCHSDWIDGCCSDCCCPFVPNMLGDSLLSPRAAAILPAFDVFGFQRHFIKVADNNSALPRDRISFSYNLMNNVPTVWNDPNLLGPTQTPTVTQETDIQEFKLNIERTFLDGMVSGQVIVPVYQTIAFTQNPGTLGAEATEFGNLAFGLKILALEREQTAISGGVLMEVPTADDFNYPTGATTNDAWWFTPYVAFQHTPTDRGFVQGFASYRARTDSQLILPTNTPVNDQNVLMFDVGAGYWLVWNPDSDSLITGIAPTVELHYTTTTEDEDFGSVTGIYFNRTDYLNLTAGLTMLIANRDTLAIGMAAPLREKNYGTSTLPTDRTFDAELIIQYNRFF